jgi:hypothetical protein
MKRFVAVGLGVFFGVATTAMARAETVTGEVVDTFCYTAMGAKGATHRQCGLDCAKKGIPVGLLENGTNKLYVLLPAKDKTAVPEAAINKMGEQASITGKMYSNGGSTFLTVESVK